MDLQHERMIDRVCTGFEEAVRRGDADIAAWLDLVPQASRERLLGDLVAIEIEVGAALGQPVDKAKYLKQFPESAGIIESAFQRVEDALLQSTVLAGELKHRYQLRGELGRGGMGVVYRAFDRVLQREVALKVLQERLQFDPNANIRFEREPQLCGGLQHPGIVPVYDSGLLDDGRPFYAMKIVTGKTLDELIRAGTNSRASLLEVFRQLCHAIACAHRSGIIHRDLKPANIMVGAFGEVYVMDWGLAGYLPPNADREDERYSEVEADEETHRQSESATVTGALVGTLRYLPPENRKRGGGISCARGDVYSLGAILCEILLGRTPFEIVERKNREWGEVENRPETPIVRMLLREASVDTALVELIDRCICSNVQSRYGDAAIVAGEFDRYLESAETRAEEAKLLAAQSEMRRSLSQWRWGVLSLAIVIGGITAASLVYYKQEQHFVKRDARTRVEMAISEASELYKEALQAKSLQASEWLRACERLARAEMIGEEHYNVREWPEYAQQLREELHFFRDISKSVNVHTDVLNNRFCGAASRDVMEEAFTRLRVIPLQTPTREAADRLRQVPAEGQKLILDRLFWYASMREEGASAWWYDLIIELESEQPEQSIAKALLADDEALLVKLAESIPVRRSPPHGLIVLAEKLVTVSRIGVAEELLRRAQAAHPANFWINSHLATFLLTHRPTEPEESLLFFAAALASDPTPGARYNLALNLQNCAKYTPAIEILENLLEEHPDYVSGIEVLAICYQASGQHELAETQWQKAIAFQRESAEEQTRFAQLLVDNGRWNDAEAILSGLCRCPTSSSESHLLALASMQELRGEFDQSLKTIKIVLERFPNHAPAHYAMASLLLQTERVEESCEYYRSALSLNPAFAEAACDLGQALIRLGRVDESLEWYREGHRLGKQRSDWRHPSAQWLEICEQVKVDIDWLEEHRHELSEWQFDAARAVDLAINSCFPTKNWEAGVRLIASFSHNSEIMEQLSADSLRRLAVIVAQYMVGRQRGVVTGDWPEGRLVELVCMLLKESAERFASELDSMPKLHHALVKKRFDCFFQNQTDAQILRDERFLANLTDQQLQVLVAICGDPSQISDSKKLD